jgi:hypothetical protein
VRGIGQVSVGGSSLPAVRVELNPTVLNAYGIPISDVRAALAAANANRPKGLVEAGSRAWWIYANDQAKTAAEYLPLIVSYRNGAAVRLGDVAQVSDSVQDIRNAGEADGRPAVIVIINREPNANILETVQRVRDLMPFLSASIPAAAQLGVAMERTATIRGSLHEVEKTLVAAVILVILVVFLFLRRVRATLIPAAAVPVSIVSTFGFMYLAGYSLNNLSLMALIVAHRLRRRRRHRGAGERHAPHRGRHAADAGGAPRRAGGRLHRGIDEHLAHRGVHTDHFHGRHRRALLPRIRPHAVGSDPGIARGVIDPDADDVRAASQEPGEGETLAVVRKDPRRLRQEPGLGVAPPDAHHAAARRHGRAQRLPLHRHSEGLLPAAGHRPHDGLRARRPDDVIPGDAGKDVAADGNRARRSRVRVGHLGHRRRFRRAQFGLYVHGAQAARRAPCGERGAGTPAAAGRQGAGRQPVRGPGAGCAHRRAAGLGHLPVHAAER